MAKLHLYQRTEETKTFKQKTYSTPDLLYFKGVDLLTKNLHLFWTKTGMKLNVWLEWIFLRRGVAAESFECLFVSLIEFTSRDCLVACDDGADCFLCRVQQL